MGGQGVEPGCGGVDPVEVGFEMEKGVIRKQRIDEAARALEFGQLPHSLEVC